MATAIKKLDSSKQPDDEFLAQVIMIELLFIALSDLMDAQLLMS